MPETQSLHCANCGAPLEVSAAARFLTCRHCGTSLEVKRSASAEWTETLQDVAQRTARIEQKVDEIRADQELEQLDREWESRKDSLMISTKEGGKVRPTTSGGVFAIVGILVFAAISVVVFSFMARVAGGMIVGLFACFFVIVIVGALFAAVKNMGSASEYDEAERKYFQDRAELLKDKNRPL